MELIHGLCVFISDQGAFAVSLTSAVDDSHVHQPGDFYWGRQKICEVNISATVMDVYLLYSTNSGQKQTISMI